MAGIDVKTEKSIGHSTNLMLTEGTKYITDNKSSRMEDIQHVQKTLLLYYIPGYTADFTTVFNDKKVGNLGTKNRAELGENFDQARKKL